MKVVNVMLELIVTVRRQEKKTVVLSLVLPVVCPRVLGVGSFSRKKEKEKKNRQHRGESEE